MTAFLQADEIYITDELTLADIRTIEVAEVATVHLVREMGHIEISLATEDIDEGRRARAESALRFKRMVRQLIERRMGDIRRAAEAAAQDGRDRALLAQLKADWPAQFAESVEKIDG